MLREAKGLVSLGSHHRLDGSSVSLFDNQELEAVRSEYVKYAKYVANLYAKYVKYVVGLYVKYVKYDSFLHPKRHFCTLSPTATNGYE